MGSALRFSVGSIDCRILVDGTCPAPLDHVYADVPRSALDAKIGSGPREIEAPFHALLVQTPDTIVLVDAGIGDFVHPAGGRGGALPDELRAAGIAPDDIDILLITHGHLDHAGGLVREGRLVFPGARHLMSRRDWEYWTAEEVLAQLPGPVADPARTALPAVAAAGKLELFDDSIEIDDGVHAVAAPGHTPGHTAVEIRAADDGALYLVDTVVHEYQFAHPGWGSLDIDRDEALRTRGRLLERAASERLLVAASHVPVAGHVRREGPGFAFSPSP